MMIAPKIDVILKQQIEYASNSQVHSSHSLETTQDEIIKNLEDTLKKQQKNPVMEHRY
jgi:hypothetical protein